MVDNADWFDENFTKSISQNFPWETVLEAAINYCLLDIHQRGSMWLRDWREGNLRCMKELEDYMKGYI